MKSTLRNCFININIKKGKAEGIEALFALLELDNKSEEVYNGVLGLIDYCFKEGMDKQAEAYCNPS